GGTAAKNLKHLLARGVSAERLLQLFLIYTARANLILRDFITDVYWPHYNAGSRVIQKQDVLDFLKAAQATEKMPNKWSDGVRLHASRDLLSALIDFKLTRDMPQGRREIVPFGIQ